MTAGGEPSLREQALTGDEAAFEALIGPLRAYGPATKADFGRWWGAWSIKFV